MRVRIRQGLGGRTLPCGCRAGVYETYAGKVVTILDARDPACTSRDHMKGHVIPPVPGENPNGGAEDRVLVHRDWRVWVCLAAIALLIWKTWVWLLRGT